MPIGSRQIADMASSIRRSTFATGCSPALATRRWVISLPHTRCGIQTRRCLSTGRSLGYLSFSRRHPGSLHRPHHRIAIGRNHIQAVCGGRRRRRPRHGPNLALAFTASLSASPALNVGDLGAGIPRASPVLGLRTERAAILLMPMVPNPAVRPSSPLAGTSTMIAITLSTTPPKAASPTIAIKRTRRSVYSELRL